MVLSIDKESDDYRYYKTLNEDVYLKPVNSTSDHWDIQMNNGDYVNLTGTDSLRNAICIAIMTRYNELSRIMLYDNFGCRAHELIKANKSEMVKYEVELFIRDVLENMRRINEIKYITVSESTIVSYHVEFSVVSINDELVSGSVEL